MHQVADLGEDQEVRAMDSWHMGSKRNKCSRVLDQLQNNHVCM
jgi:hypothetical protein